MVSTTPPVTTMMLFSRYWPTPLSQALAKFDHWKDSGSAHGEPKISPEVFNEASSAHTNGTSTITDQPISTTCENTLTAASPAPRPCGRRRPGGAALSWGCPRRRCAW